MPQTWSATVPSITDAANHIPISLCAYTSDAEPQILMDTKCGKSMFRGTYETQLIQGVAHYSKIQFR